MSVFTKPLSQLTWPDLQDLKTAQAVENLRLEFKQDTPNRDETLKKLSSFANTYGGYLIVGATAGSKDGRLVDLSGVDPLPNYKQTVVQWCADGATPYLDVDVSDPIQTPSGGGKVCYVLFVAESDSAPHFLNERKGIYIRTNEFSARFEAKLANEPELRQLFDRRRIIRERRSVLIQRARARFRTFTERRYKELAGQERIGCRFDLSIIPRFPSAPICDHDALNKLIGAKRVGWRNNAFPLHRGGAISQHESAIALHPGSSFSMLEMNTWGLLFYATEIQDSGPKVSGIHIHNFIGHLLVFLEHARVLLREIGYVGPLLLELRMESIRGVPWLYPDDWHFDTGPGPSSELDDEVTFHIAASTESLQERRDEHAMDILKYVFFALNWTEMADSQQKLEGLIRAGYTFNIWSMKEKGPT